MTAIKKITSSKYTRVNSIAAGIVNPYLLKAKQFEKRLFLFEDPEGDLKEIRKKIDNYRGILVEVGSGSGMHLIELAKKHPQKIVFGFEIRFKRAVKTLEKALREKLDNLHVLLLEGEYLQNIFEEKTVNAIYVNYPDPWAKLRWQKNRLLNSEFLDQSFLLLKSRGFLSVKTDHAEYFDSFKKIVDTDPRFIIKELSLDLKNSEYWGANIPTEFEGLFVKQNLKLCYGVFAITGADPIPKNEESLQGDF
jgi:tRNA (guanine-N7-)-methyltransferase